MTLRHRAVFAGLTAVCAFALTGAPAAASADTGGLSSAASDATAQLPAPGDFDRADAYEEDPSLSSDIDLLSGGSARLAPQALSSEMKYFAENESGSNYNQGFSYGDGYNAMGFYQFDRRYALVPFIQAVYEYNPTKYAMFGPVVARGEELKAAAIYDSATKQLTEIGRLAEDAWHAAYQTDPTEFAALQDAYAYQEYYQPVERILRNTFGVDISGRADCVKGLAWSLCNLFGSGGCQKFFRDANLTSSMTDRQFVNALCDAVVRGVYTYDYAYADSYAARYERERATCLAYIAEDEAGLSSTLPFADVGDAWYTDAVAYMYEHGYMSGVDGPVKYFYPNSAIKREDAAVVIYNILGGGQSLQACGLADVNQGAYYAKAVNWVVARGYMQGYQNAAGVYTEFGVGDYVTREQLACVIANIARVPGSAVDASKFTAMLDWRETSPWAQGGVIWALANGAINGVPTANGYTISPARNASRAEMAVIMKNCIDQSIF